MESNMAYSPKQVLNQFYKVSSLAISISILSACGSGSATLSTESEPQTSTNTAPLANAGSDQTVNQGDTVTVDGSASSDADGDSLAYIWVLDSTPAGSSANLQNQSAVSASFIVDIAGNYVISLQVNDGTVNSQSDTVTISVGTDGVDITDAEFSSRAGSCDNYAGSYYSNVTDIQRSMDFSGDIMISSDGITCTIASNNIPNHDFNDQSASFATNVSTQNKRFELPVNPQMAAQATAIDLQTTNVIFLNGAIVDVIAAACYGVGNEPLGQEKIGCGQDQLQNPWRYDPMSPLNNFGTDMHNAHVQPDGAYHYHGNPLAMYDQNCETSAVASPVIGFAADGYPVYGPCFTDSQSSLVRKAQSSYALKSNGGARQAVNAYSTPVSGQGAVASGNYDGQFTGDYDYVSNSGDLDECNGMTVNGQYGYYITDAYPWVLACYKGDVDPTFVKNAPELQNRMHSHDTLSFHSH
jgi:hypothetical protein